MLAAFARPAAAQSPADARRSHRFEVTVGGLWLSAADVGGEVAELRANRVPPAPFRLFTTETHADAAPGVDARLGFWLTRDFAVEAGFVFARPPLETRITADAEGAAALTVSEDVDQYFIDANVVWLVDRFRFWQLVPFVSGGAGYLRQLHEGRTLVETGQVYHVGGGLRHWLRMTDRGWIRGMGVRFEGRAYVLADGVQLEDRPRTHGAFSGSLFVTF
jgi:hypothetical protein